MTTVLVTGGTGFIGSRLALAHVERGDVTRAFAAVNSDNESRVAEDLNRAGVEVRIGDIRRPEEVGQALSGVDTVYHLAAAQHEAGVPDEYFRTINVEGTKNLYDAAVARGVKRVIHGSTIGVYGEVEDNVPVSEKSEVNPDNIYGLTKLEGEKIALDHAQQVPTCVARISETYGPGDFRLLKMFKGVKKGRFPLIGSGRNVHQLIYVDDLLNGLMRLADSERRGEIYLLGGSERITTVEMIDYVRKAVGGRRAAPRVPYAPMEVAARLCEATFTPLGLKPPLHRRRLDFFRKSFLLDCRKARDELDSRPRVSFERGCVKTAEWYSERGYL